MKTTTLNEILKKIKERQSNAIGGKWKAVRINGLCAVESFANGGCDLISERQYKNKDDWRIGYDTALFISHARKDVPNLIKALELALYYVEGDSAYEGLCVKIEKILAGEE